MFPSSESQKEDSPTPPNKEKKSKRDTQRKKKAIIIANDETTRASKQSMKRTNQRTLNHFFKKIPKNSSNEQTTTSEEFLPASKRTQQLEEELKQKQAVIQSLTGQIKNEERRNSRLNMENAESKLRTKQTIADLKRDIANAVRKRNGQINSKFGYFKDQKCANFAEGEYLTEIKEKIVEAEKDVKEQLSLKSFASEDDKNIRTSKLQFRQKQLQQLRSELLVRDKEVSQYKQRQRAYWKEKTCFFAKQGWPVLKNRYLPLLLIGSGGFGEVYKGFDIERYQEIAIKILTYDSNLPEQSLKFNDYLNKEIKIHRQLSHTNIVKMLDQFNTDNRNGFVMEYCSGPELRTYLKRQGCLDERQSKNIIRQVLCGIKYLQEQNYRVVHYDLKPANILFHHGVVKILDFGISKQIQSDESKADITTPGMGTYWYLPPEVFQMQNAQYSGKVDIWSVGVIFFEILYGRKPFGDNLNQDKYMKYGAMGKLGKVNFPQHSPKNYRISQDAKKFIEACLQQQPKDRLSYLDAYNHEYFQ